MFSRKGKRVLYTLWEKPPERTRWCIQSLSNAANLTWKGTKGIIDRLEDKEKKILDFPWVETSEEKEHGIKIIFVELTEEGEMHVRLLKYGYEPGIWT